VDLRTPHRQSPLMQSGVAYDIVWPRQGMGDSTKALASVGFSFREVRIRNFPTS
jgi:hypothetical protein